uniref:Uncharacterized protein n=1 Tax=Rhizophora mucronata TaxID=61149 RepID=A0A2P2KBZ1_RHIMU
MQNALKKISLFVCSSSIGSSYQKYNITEFSF